jgi:hypothetical protein
VKQHADHIDDLVIVSPFQMRNFETIDVPFSKTTNQTDIFWRLIYAIDCESFVFISPNEPNVKYDVLKKLALIDGPAFVTEPSILYTFGKNYTSDIFKIDRNRQGFALFKTFEYAYRNPSEFEKFIYAPDRCAKVSDIQRIFSHCIFDDNVCVIEKDAICTM